METRDYHNEIRAERDRLRADVERLKEALKPFACEPDLYEPSWIQNVGWRDDGNFVRARAALAAISDA